MLRSFRARLAARPREETTISGMLDDWIARRQAANERVLSKGTLTTKRFFALDGQAYDDGALTAKTKELMGLVASTVLRCNDCITYHVLQAIKTGAASNEIVEALDVALVVGGSITIPHVRHAQTVLQEIEQSGGLPSGW